MILFTKHLKQLTRKPMAKIEPKMQRAAIYKSGFTADPKRPIIGIIVHKNA